MRGAAALCGAAEAALQPAAVLPAAASFGSCTGRALRNFDRVLVMSNGRLEEQGRFAELDRTGLLMSLLMVAE
jgi:hypothetical protein